MQMEFTDFIAQVGSYELAEAKGSFIADGNEINFSCLVFTWENYEFSSGFVSLHLDDGTKVTIRRDRADSYKDSLLATADDKVLCECNWGGVFCEEPVSNELLWKTDHPSELLSFVVNNATEIFWNVLKELDNFTKRVLSMRWAVYSIAADHGVQLTWHVSNFQSTGVEKCYECDVSLDFQHEPVLHLIVGEKGIMGILPPRYALTPLNAYLNGAAFESLNEYVKAYTVAFEHGIVVEK